MRHWVKSESVSSVVSGDILNDLVRIGAILLYDGELSPNSRGIDPSQQWIECYGIRPISDWDRRNQAMPHQIKNYQHRVAGADAEEPPVGGIDCHSRRSLARL